MAEWTKITEDKDTGEITVKVKVAAGIIIPVVGYNWDWILNILSTVFGIK